MTRYKFIHDDDATFEECNGEERPLTEAEYADNVYRACPAHPRAGSCFTTWKGKTVTGCATCSNPEYVDIPYSEYLAYSGNPDRHVYLSLIQETQCPCCNAWKVTDSLHGIDFMDDSPEYHAVQLDTWMDAATASALPGYLGELVREMELSD